MSGVRRGDIWWADVPGDRVRPVLVLTRARFVEYLDPVLVAPLTTAVRGIPTEIAVGPADGVPRPSAVNFDNVFSLRKARLRARITTLSPARLDEACAAYRFAVGC